MSLDDEPLVPAHSRRFRFGSAYPRWGRCYFGRISKVPPDEAQCARLIWTAQAPTRQYTYPMAMLTSYVAIPRDDELNQLQSLFFTSFKQHIYLNAVDIPDYGPPSRPPYLQLALACLASAAAPTSNRVSSMTESVASQADASTLLFTVGVNLWSTMLEVDNREARKFEAVVAVSFGDRGAAPCSNDICYVERQLTLLPRNAGGPTLHLWHAID